jgi:hypothetical protein
MDKIKADYWKIDSGIVRLQVKTTEEQVTLEGMLPDWRCVSFGYIPGTDEDIYVFENHFATENDWVKFLNSDKINKILDIREVEK